ncbi:MAG: hypothetical protein AAB371_02465 [Patescibacteria group bacterium]
MRTKFKALKYTMAVFAIIMFAWWFSGGHFISFLGPKPAPSEVIVLGTANALQWGASNIFNFVKDFFNP